MPENTCSNCWGRGECICTGDAANKFQLIIDREWVWDDEEGGYLLHVGKFTAMVREVDDYADWSISFRDNIIEIDEVNTLTEAREAAERELRVFLTN